MPSSVNPAGMNPAAGTLPANAQVVTPGGGALNYAAEGGLPAEISQILGKTTTDFLNLMGDTPEERAQNLEAFTKTMNSINQIGQGLGQTSLIQRMGAKRGAELVQERAGSMPPQALEPLPPMSPEMVRDMLNSVGLGAQAIAAATRPPR